jgi:GNAT superfamily N-acetyltransferase
MLTEALSGALKSTIVRLSSAVTATPRAKALPVVAKAATIGGAGYPRELERVVPLRDGAVVRVRPIRSDDEARLAALFGRLSERTIYHRFFTTYRRLPAAWYHDFANVDYVRRLALVAEEVGAHGVQLRGVARWEPGDAPETVEMALVVEDAWQGRGLGVTMLNELMAAARARGVERFCADVLAENHRMLRLLRTATEVRTSSFAEGVVHLCVVPRAPAVGVV